MVKLHDFCEGCRKLTEELEEARHDALVADERSRAARDLVLALGQRLRKRHHEVRELRARLAARAVAA